MSDGHADSNTRICRSTASTIDGFAGREYGGGTSEANAPTHHAYAGGHVFRAPGRRRSLHHRFWAGQRQYKTIFAPGDWEPPDSAPSP
jgi:hypothetical protein